MVDCRKKIATRVVCHLQLQFSLIQDGVEVASEFEEKPCRLCSVSVFNSPQWGLCHVELMVVGWVVFRGGPCGVPCCAGTVGKC